MAMMSKIRRMYFREKKSVREISRLTSLSRNTIDKWLKAPVDGEPKYVRRPQAGKLHPFHEQLKLWLVADAHRPRVAGVAPPKALYAQLPSGRLRRWLHTGH